MPKVIKVIRNDGVKEVYGDTLSDMIAGWDVKAGFLLMYHSEYSERVTAIPESSIRYFDTYDYRKWEENKRI